MDRALPLRIPIENFIVTTDEKYPNKYRLIYFDPRGQRHEILVRKNSIDAAIQKLDGKPKAISRSSGGLAALSSITTWLIPQRWPRKFASKYALENLPEANRAVLPTAAS
jgi:hypothetical protein